MLNPQPFPPPFPKQPPEQTPPLIPRSPIREIDRVNRPRLFHNVENFVRGSRPSKFDRQSGPARTECSKEIPNSNGKFAFFDWRAGTYQNRHDLRLKLFTNFNESL